MKKLNKFMCVFLSAAMLVSAGTTSLADRSAEPQIGYYRAAASEQGVEGFISRLYKLAMGRDADGDGLKYWCDQLDNGTITASNIARFFFSCDASGSSFQSLNRSRVHGRRFSNFRFSAYCIIFSFRPSRG